MTYEEYRQERYTRDLYRRARVGTWVAVGLGFYLVVMRIGGVI